MSEPRCICLLEDCGLLRFRGPGALRFLQGQLSSDLMLLNADHVQRAGLHNPQGRTLALLWLMATAPDEISAVLPLELVTDIATLLRRYVLRAPLTISDESAQHRIYGVSSGSAPAPDGRRQFIYEGSRMLLICSANQAPAAAGAMTREQWRALDVAAGLPQVYRTTAGQFVAQMLNLDCIDAISFSKGCYTGQEVIARAHYRGRVKRRMQRFLSRAALQLAAGDSGWLEDGRSMRVVEAVQRPDKRCEFLAVAALASSSTEPDDADTSRERSPIACTSLPLPYELPD